MTEQPPQGPTGPQSPGGPPLPFPTASARLNRACGEPSEVTNVCSQSAQVIREGLRADDGGGMLPVEDTGESEERTQGDG